MKTSLIFYTASLISVALLSGCGGGADKKNRDFFTSGNREADQRADQRMAKSEQLKGSRGASTTDKKADENKSLFDRLGGETGVRTLVNDFTPRLLADPRVNFVRKGVTLGGFNIHSGKSMTWNATPANVEQMEKHIAQFLALATGGPAHYDGREMKEAHTGLHISNAEFDASIGDLKASLDKLLVPVKEQKEVLSIVESTRTQIVEDR
jgi:hemoglobin